MSWLTLWSSNDRQGNRVISVTNRSRGTALLAIPRADDDSLLCIKMSVSPRSGLKLSLERLYKDDLGRPIPIVSDITSDGHHIFEPCASATLGIAVVRELTTCSGQ